MAETYKLTKEGYEKLKAEKDELKNRLMGEIAEKIKSARELGDLSENSEYEEAKNEQGKIDSRIKEIEYILDNSEILEDEEGNNTEVKLGKIVKIHDYGLKIDKEFRLVTPQEADIKKDKISTESIIGKNILGKKINDTVVIKTLNGKNKKIKILNIH
ncbi:transcription elongation factor GreA [Tepiditoga spiralis]|uniref:Transcription elongation factor GreA n=1 Tax=Tepiditoga spiralis TaxID=2108365 RepID=A0A7G1G590_9BACT|nr:transcription elongation factor GreA [Tepiditoga spiralis]BBE30436.1 transcription elongation factor GreA [Tepiditoga spiralis]